MKALSMFQRAMLMYMCQEERMHGGKRVGVMRAALEWSLQFTWQSHYTDATKELKQLGWIEIRNYWGKHQYVLTDLGRAHMCNHVERASKLVLETRDQRVMFEGEKS